MKWYLNFILVLLLTPVMANAQVGQLPQAFSFDGVLTNSSGTAITAAGTQVKFQILNPSKSCVIYEEEHTVNPDANGGISVKVGGGTRTANDLGKSWKDIFTNAGTMGPMAGTCASPYNPGPMDNRYLRVIINSTDTLSPDVAMNSVPMATVAETLQGKAPGDFIAAGASHLNQADVQNIFSSTNYPILTSLLATPPFNPVTASAPVSFNNQIITNVGAPGVGTDAVNKNYADQNIGAKQTNLSAIGPGIGNGRVLTWDSAANQWVASIPSATDNTKLPLDGSTAMTGALMLGSNNINGAGHITMMPDRVFHLSNVSSVTEGTFAFSAPDSGKMWYRSDTKQLRLFDGVSIVTVGGGGGTGDFKADGSVPMSASSQLRLDAGTAGIPSLTFNGDVSTGIYNSGAGSLAMTHNGTPSFVFSQSGFQSFPAGGASLRSNTGMASWPTYGFSGDLDTGIFSPSSDFISFATMGQERMTLSNTGNLGIGVLAPNAPLHVKGIFRLAGITSGSVSLRAPASGGTANWELPGADGAANQVLRTDGAGILSWATMPAGSIGSVGQLQMSDGAGGFMNSTNLQWQAGPDRLGVGTPSPTARLHVNGTVVVGNGGESCAAVPGGLRYNGSGMEFCNGSTWGPLGAMPVGPNGSIQFSQGAAFASNNYLFWDNTNQRLGVGSSVPSAVLHVFNNGSPSTPVALFKGTSGQSAPYLEVQDMSGISKFRVDQAGNVGIGLPAPAYPLHVSGGPQQVAAFESGNPSGAGITLSSMASGGLDWELISTASSSPQGASKLAFIDTMSGITSMVIDGNQNVGIGITNPTNRLEVAGPTQVGQLKVGTAITGGAPVSNMRVCQFSTTSITATSSAATFQNYPCAGATLGSMVSCSPDQIPGANTVAWATMIDSPGQIRITLTNTQATSYGFTSSTMWKCLVVN